MRKGIAAWAALVTIGAGLPAGAQAAPDPTGLWLTENERSAIRVERCGDRLCGRVAWIIEGGMQYDSENPDESLRDRPMCGLEILRGLEQDPDDPEDWEDGEVYKADEGDTYDADLTVKGPDRLKVRGYVGISLFGKSQIWRRVSEADYPPCTPPEG